MSRASTVLTVLGKAPFVPHPQAQTAYNAMVTAGVTPTQDSLRRLTSAYQVLETAGILDEMVSHVWFSTDWQGSTGTPRNMAGVAAASFADGFTRSRWGLTTNQATTSGIGFTVPDTRTGTIVVGHGGDGVNGNGVISMISGASNGNDGHRWLMDGTNRARLANYAAGSFVNQTNSSPNSGVSRHIYSRAAQLRTHAITFGTATPAQWVDGIECDISPNVASATSSNPLTRWSFFRLLAGSTTWSSVAAFIRRGTIPGAMLFNRVLTTAEVREATRAMAILEPAEVLLALEGDSTMEAILFPGRQVADIGHRILAMRNNVRVMNAATSGHALMAFDGTFANFDTQLSFWRPSRNRFWSRGIAVLTGGINDAGQNTGTPAQVVAAAKAYLGKMKEAGYETVFMVPAPPILNGGAWTTTMRDHLASQRTLLLAEHAAGTLNADYILRADQILPHDGTDDADWFDFAHPNQSGNQKLADAVVALVGI